MRKSTARSSTAAPSSSRRSRFSCSPRSPHPSGGCPLARSWPDACSHLYGQEPRRRRAGEGAVRGRPDRKAGRASRRDRSTCLPGAARAGRRTARARPRAARERAPRPRALPHALQAGLDRQAAGRHPGVARAPVRGRGGGRREPDREREAAARLCAHRRADQRPHRPAPGRSRQHRALGRRQRPRRDHAAAAGGGAFHRAAGPAALRAEAYPVRRPDRGRGLGPGAEGEARRGHARLGGQPGRSANRHGETEGAVRERRRRALPEPVRQRAHEARHAEERHRRAAGRRAARRAGHVRLRGTGRPHGRAAQREARPARRPAPGDRGRPRRGRARRHRRHRSPASGSASGRRLGASRFQAAGGRRAQRRRQAPLERRRMNPSRLFILRPVATTLLMVAVLLVGFVAYRQLPISALPQVDYPTIQVFTFYPGASPEVMASSVTAPLERQFGQTPGLKQMLSTSSGGASVITLQFDLAVPLDVAEQGVQAAINAGSNLLPQDLPAPPVYSKVNPADAPILTLGLSSRSMSLPDIQNLADTRLAQKLSQVAGVGLVTLSGGQRPAVRVQANPLALAANGLGLEDVRSAIAATNVKRAKGSLDGPSRAYTIDANDQLSSAPQYRSVVVAYRNGAPIYLSDVADVVDGAENARLAAWMNDVPAVILNIQRQPGANVIDVVDRIKRQLPQLQAALPAAIDVAVLTDRTVTIRASVRDVQIELLFAVALVVLVIFLFLRNLPATVIPSVAVPLSLIGTFGFIYLAGFSINNLTLMALVVAAGFVVDDAIVVIENIARHIEQGSPPLQAALNGSPEIGFTIISLTFSLIAVLIPLLFMGDVVGRLFREFAVTLAVAILISGVVSLTLTPMMCARLLRHKTDEQQSRFYHASGRAFDRMIEFYGRTLRWVLDHQTATLVVAVGTLLMTVLLYIVIPKGFFPVQDTGVILGISEAEPTVSFPAMAERQQALASVILRDPAVESLSSFIGVDGTNTTPNSGRIQINLKPLDARDISASDVIRRLQPELAKVEGITLYMQPVQDLSVEDRVSRTQYQYSMEDPDADELDRWVPQFVSQLQSLPELRDVASDQQNRGLQARLVIDRNTAARFGITPQMIDDALYDAFGQRQVSTMFTQLNQYRVVLEAEPQLQRNPEDLRNIYIRPAPGSPGTNVTNIPSTASGAPPVNITSASAVNVTPRSTSTPAGAVPLSAFTHLETVSAPLSLTRQGQFPATTISFNLAPRVSLGEAVQKINQTVRDVKLPASIVGSFQGTAQAFETSLTNEPLLILAALITVYIVLGVLYESYIHPITILSTLPSAGVGALLALLICRIDFSLVALIGIILLIGIVKKNAIMMIDFALEAERKEGLSAEESIYQACLLRFRPIMMTTAAALLGALPLAIESGTGSELRRPLGISIVGGLLLSQFLTLYTTPVIYLYLDRFGGWMKERRRRGEVAQAELPLRTSTALEHEPEPQFAGVNGEDDRLGF